MTDWSGCKWINQYWLGILRENSSGIIRICCVDVANIFFNLISFRFSFENHLRFVSKNIDNDNDDDDGTDNLKMMMMVRRMTTMMMMSAARVFEYTEKAVRHDGRTVKDAISLGVLVPCTVSLSIGMVKGDHCLEIVKDGALRQCDPGVTV